MAQQERQIKDFKDFCATCQLRDITTDLCTRKSFGEQQHAVSKGACTTAKVAGVRGEIRVGKNGKTVSFIPQNKD